MLSTHRTFSVGLLSASKRFLIYCSVRMPHLQNCVMIRSLAGLRMVGGGCRQRGMSALGKRNWGREMWCSNGGGEHGCGVGSPSGMRGVEGSLQVYVPSLWGTFSSSVSEVCS